MFSLVCLLFLVQEETNSFKGGEKWLTTLTFNCKTQQKNNLTEDKAHS